MSPTDLLVIIPSGAGVLWFMSRIPGFFRPKSPGIGVAAAKPVSPGTEPLSVHGVTESYRSMVYLVTSREIHKFPVHAKFLDAPAESAFRGTRFEQDPADLDLNVVELEGIAKGKEWAAISRGYRILSDGVPRKIL